MKATITCTLLILACTISGMAQQLAGTSWDLYPPGSQSKIGEFQFTTDSIIIYDPSTGSSNVLASYTQNGSDFYITDKLANPCGSDVGHYTFTILNDTLDFTTVNDNCTAREAVLANYTFARTSVGISENYLDKHVVLYPNPAKEVVQIDFSRFMLKREFQITNAMGQVVMRQTIDQLNIGVELGDLAPGLYFLTVSDVHQSALRFVKR
jgi:hypothetical protein